MKIVMLTTEDNPYDPFTQFRDWYAWDVRNGYNTSAYMARVNISSHELTAEQQRIDLENAIDSILDLNLTGNYKKVEMDSDELDAIKARQKANEQPSKLLKARIDNL